MVKTEQQPSPRDDAEIHKAEQNLRVKYLCEYPLAELRQGIAALDGDARRSCAALIVLLVLGDLPAEQRSAILTMIRTGIYFPASA